MPYGLTYNPNNAQQSTNTFGQKQYALNPTFSTASTYKNPNIAPNGIDPSTSTYRSWGDMTNSLGANNQDTQSKVDWYENWRKQTAERLKANPQQLGAFNKQFTPQFTFNYGINSGPAAHAQYPNMNFGMDYGTPQDPTKTPAALMAQGKYRPFDDVQAKQLGMTPDKFKAWYAERTKNTAAASNKVDGSTQEFRDFYGL